MIPVIFLVMAAALSGCAGGLGPPPHRLPLPRLHEPRCSPPRPRRRQKERDRQDRQAEPSHEKAKAREWWV